MHQRVIDGLQMWFSVNRKFAARRDALRPDGDFGLEVRAVERGDIQMSDKRARKFDKLLEDHKDARHRRKKAASARREIKGLDGRIGALSALASPTGAKAVAAELDALKAERRALQRLFIFAVKHATKAALSDESKITEGKSRKRTTSKVASTEINPEKTKSVDRKNGQSESEP